MQNGEPQIYTSVATLRNAQIQLQWSFFQLFFVFNSAGLSVLLSDKQIDEEIKLFLTIVGLLTHAGLIFASYRAITWLDYYDSKLARLEKLDQEASDRASNRIEVFSDYEFGDRKGGKLARHGYLFPLSLGGIVWLVLTGHHLILYLLTVNA
jgi:hypothetical protein